MNSEWLIYMSIFVVLLFIYWIINISPLSNNALFLLFTIFLCLIYSGGLIVYGYNSHKNSEFLLAGLIIFSAGHKFYLRLYKPFVEQAEAKNRDLG